MAASDKTKKVRNSYRLAKFLSFIVTTGPLLVYVMMGLIRGSVTISDKIVLSLTVIAAIILTLVNILMKYHLRSPLFIILLGVYCALDKLLPLILTIAIGTILDEFIFTPWKKSAKAKLVINRELDDRLG